jgi:2-polyprenyl-6-methoxyphenol hydroxylase-like FAD-dependent oxidoreductase
MMLAYQLASNGVPVHVFERHRDFDREFRGEFVQPSVLVLLEKLGMLADLRRGRHIFPIQAVRMRGRNGRIFASNVSTDGNPVSEAIHQPSFLGILDEQCRRYSGYRLELGGAVTDLAKDERRVSGVVVRRDGVEERVAGSLVVVCTGRGSALRKAVSLDAVELVEAVHAVVAEVRRVGEARSLPRLP